MPLRVREVQQYIRRSASGNVLLDRYSTRECLLW